VKMRAGDLSSTPHLPYFLPYPYILPNDHIGLRKMPIQREQRLTLVSEIMTDDHCNPIRIRKHIQSGAVRTIAREDHLAGSGC